MDQRVHIANIAVNHVQAALRQCSKHIWVEIDDANLVQHQWVPPFDLAQQCAGGTKESQDNDPPRFALAVFMRCFRRMDMVEVAKPNSLQRTDGEPRDLVAAHYQKCTQYRQQHECE